ncbi:MAG: peptide deformylase [Omnitrophica WOR_2 bacterium GWA2_47_8]|nr:MAG: peptide deformylase [Omnitrophica WOR_2 bacterium GWA2_47_8]
MATKLKIRIYGDPCLRKKSSLVKDVGPAERQLIASLLETMYEYKGVGLAAPQVGINEQIFVADVGAGPLVFINPKIIRKKGSVVLEEGCLSIPGVTVGVKRPSVISVRYLNEENRTLERECTELLARVIQHETDHLNGKLIVDYLSLAQKRKFKKQLKEIEAKK